MEDTSARREVSVAWRVSGSDPGNGRSTGSPEDAKNLMEIMTKRVRRRRGEAWPPATAKGDSIVLETKRTIASSTGTAGLIVGKSRRAASKFFEPILSGSLLKKAIDFAKTPLLH